MKKTILYILILFSVHCTAQSIFDILTNESVINSGLSSFIGYDDLYYYKNSNGEKKYLNKKTAGTKFKPETYFIDNIEIKINRWDFYVNDLSALKDRINFESESIEVSINSEYNDFDFGFSSQYVNDEIKYNIYIFDGKIPISYFHFNSKIKYQNLKLDLNLLNGDESKGSFSNKINGFSTALSFDKSFSKIHFSINGNYTFFSADLKKDNSTFCELNGIQLLQYSCSGKYNLHSFNSIFVGITGIETWQRERGFFNAEPFIDFYSLFFGSKTFIKKIDLTAILPFVSYEHNIRFHSIPISASIDYYHIFINSNIVYTERIWLIPGIWPDDSTKHKLDIDPDVDGILRLQVKGELIYKKFLFGIIGSQLLPIDYSNFIKSHEPSPGETKANERGGTSIFITIGYLF